MPAATARTDPVARHGTPVAHAPCPSVTARATVDQRVRPRFCTVTGWLTTAVPSALRTSPLNCAEAP